MIELLGTRVSGAAQTYVDDVFSTYLYTGNGSTQTITNGIDLAGKGGLVWIKARSIGYSHMLVDTARGVDKQLASQSTQGHTSPDDMASFTSTGFSLDYQAGDGNASGQTYASWTFRKAAKFLDVVTYTGDGANRTISHSLGSVPGMIVVKRTDAVSEWKVYHNSIANTEFLALNTTAAKATDATLWNSTTATSSVFSIGTHADVNTNAGTYVAYLFAHDTGTDGIIQCGSYTGNGSMTGPTVTLGWEPQWVMIKKVSSATNSDWYLIDNMRSMTSSSSQNATLYANLSVAEDTGQNNISPTATGFYPITNSTALNGNGDTYIYLAIRRPNKPPTTGTQVYNAIARTGTGAVASVTGAGFALDAAFIQSRDFTTNYIGVHDKLRGPTMEMYTQVTDAESSAPNSITSFDMGGITVGADGTTNRNGYSIINHFFRRAPGVFDIVCYTGTWSNKTETHNLTVAPEFWIIKGRSGATAWAAGCTALANTEYLVPNTTAAKATGATYWNSTFPTSTVFSIGTSGNVNTSTATYVAYLFATKAGISKVGSFTGNGSNQTIDCGFSAGARFVLIKRTDSTGDWYIWDTVRGIVAGNDPHLSLNTTAAEVTTDDSIDTASSGFIVNQDAATNINVNTATYIFLAFA